MRERVIAAIAAGLTECITARGERIIEKFTSAEIYDFANTVYTFLPTSLEHQTTDFDAQMEGCFAGKENFVKVMADSLLRSLAIKLIKKQDISIKEYLHLTYLNLLLIKSVSDDDIDEMLEEVANYYNSLLLTANDLPDNVANIQTDAVTVANPYSELCVRVDYNNNTLVPSLRTLTNFKNLTLPPYDTIT